MKQVIIAIALLFAGIGNAQAATPMDDTCAVSGSDGDWSYDFSVTNNLSGANKIYAVALVDAAFAVTGTPTGWANINYQPTEWCTQACFGVDDFSISPGATITGFIVHTTGVTALSSFNYLVAVYGGDLGNPVYYGVAGAVPNAIPEPATWTMLLFGFGALGLALRSRRPAPLISA